MLKVTVRATVSAESLTLIVLKLGGFWMLKAPRMSCTLPALPTLTVSSPAADAQAGRHAGGEDVDRVGSPSRS